MDIILQEFLVKDIFKGFIDKGEEGVWAYEGKLNIRPIYQRELVYEEEDQAAVIETISCNFPINVMYWIKNKENDYEVLDGQQRIMSIMNYMNNDFSVASFEGLKDSVAWIFKSLPQEKKDIINNYKLYVYICTGDESEKIKWFEKINFAGKKLTNQEIRNAIYSGKWLIEAKKFFSKANCPAHHMGKKYLKGTCTRQEYLETVLSWISNSKNDSQNIDDKVKAHLSIAEYMCKHRHDDNAEELISYFKDIITWIKCIFIEDRKEMKGIPWGFLYNEYKNHKFNAQQLEKTISELMSDSDVTNKQGIYRYVFDQQEKHLSLRLFEENDKKTKFEEQQHKCCKCNKICDFEDTEADHIIPWSKGGKTQISNLQILCKACNRTKSNK